jgi:hypothetical protein
MAKSNKPFISRFNAATNSQSNHRKEKGKQNAPPLANTQLLIGERFGCNSEKSF